MALVPLHLCTPGQSSRWVFLDAQVPRAPASPTTSAQPRLCCPHRGDAHRPLAGCPVHGLCSPASGAGGPGHRPLIHSAPVSIVRSGRGRLGAGSVLHGQQPGVESVTAA